MAVVEGQKPQVTTLKELNEELLFHMQDTYQLVAELVYNKVQVVVQAIS